MDPLAKSPTGTSQLAARPAVTSSQGSGGWRFRWQMSASRLTAPVSSRIGRSPERVAAWFRGLRAICASVGAEGGRLLVADGTTTARFVLRAAQLFGTPTSVVMCLSKSQDDPTEWLKEWTQYVNKHRDQLQDVVVVSPVFGDRPNRVEPAGVIPAADVDLLDAADRVVALSIRARGNLHKLLVQSLSSNKFDAGDCRIVCGTDLTKDRVREDLLRQGAVGWTPLHSSGKVLTVVSSIQEPPANTREFHGITPLPSGNFLTHCTRRRHGPWPNQDEQSYLDDLILERPAADHSPLAALTRIVTERRLIASDQWTRDSTPVVCLTAVPLRELHDLRVFRPHLGRWDFQPYGVSICRAALDAVGARPVCYATDQDWERLSEADRPFFQLAAGRGAPFRTMAPLDWTVEQEWRHVGHLDLAQFQVEDIVVFVPTEREAAILKDKSPWPVCVLK